MDSHGKPSLVAYATGRTHFGIRATSVWLKTPEGTTHRYVLADSWDSLPPKSAIPVLEGSPLPDDARWEAPPIVTTDEPVSAAYTDYDGDTVWVFVSCGRLSVVARCEQSGSMYEHSDGLPARLDVVRSVLARADGRAS